MDRVHEGILRKFQFLKGKLLIGKVEIKGESSQKKLPPDQFVPEPHILHDLIRGFYKPAKKPYLLSYQATELDSNYGKQIIWDKKGYSFIKIEMKPPSGEKDNRKISDIEAARYNLLNNIPIGILHKENKGKNRVLGLGIIVSERADGVFLVDPYEFKEDTAGDLQFLKKMHEDLDIYTNIVQQILQSNAQEYFRNKLLLHSQQCVICGIKERAFLLASYIKPWRYSSHNERVDENNGLLFCPNHEKIFNCGYISFSSNGKILISSELPEEIIRKINLSSEISIKTNIVMETYMKWHRKNCFKK
ncbi:HNH endonuclease signature motif containing protein [Bacillus sp. JJ1773]|uniref:HNH endonuclease n=1 Tax=Bacillus sp. JJ1773 TaxID=3122965 RepID=UPI003000C6F3